MNIAKLALTNAQRSAANDCLTSLDAAMMSKEGYERSIKQLIAAFSHKRSVALMECLGAIASYKYPRCTFEITQMMGQFNVRFEGAQGETAKTHWAAYIRPYLPQIKKATHKKAAGRVSHVDRVEKRFALTLKNHKTVTLAQAIAAVKEAWNAAHGK